MDNQRLNKGLLLLGFILSLIFLLLSVPLQWINDNTFIKLEEIIPYKWMLLILITVILILFYILIYLKLFPKNIKNQEIEKICPKCGKPDLKVIQSTIRSISYKCENCGFDHKVIKEGYKSSLHT